jgi:SAM-dependent methyltransferase
LRLLYPDLANKKLVPVGIIDDGERLASVPDGSQDFVVANHFLEHCEDPIGAVKTLLRVLRPGGVAYLTVPDMRFTFDRPRAPTPIAHLLEDHAGGAERSRRSHYEEWVTAVEGNAGPGATDRAEGLLRSGYSIHFHAWTPAEWLELLAWVRREWPCEVELLLRRKGELLTVLRKGHAELPDRVVPAHVA